MAEKETASEKTEKRETQAPTETELLKLMQDVSAKLQPLPLADRRRVLSSVATMLGVSGNGTPQRQAQQQQRQGQRNSGGRS